MEKIKVLDKMTPHETCWVPVVWAIRLLTSAHEDDKNMRRLESPVFANLLSAIDKIEANNRKLLNYGWVNFPLAYTQIANFSVFMYVTVSLFACQFLHPKNISEADGYWNITGVAFSSEAPYDEHTPDIYVPWFTMVEFISYMGWIKV